ncbi:MAG: potassium channel family protein [Propionibacteriaceae bacterium]|jgi:voltage-gated potassium channel|nr:potassium channel family protein [Propionibacteriaceae bacterium]
MAPKIKFSPSEAPWAGRLQVHLPARSSTPASELVKRLGMALLLVLAITLVVWFDRDSYVDMANHDGINLIDAFYYATVTMTTTGYGDIVPTTDHARLIIAIIVTPMRVGFLVLLVGTTVEVLANEGRRALMDATWRKNLRGHTVVIGYGTMGQSAVSTLLSNGVPNDKIVVIDTSAGAVGAANRANLAAFEGDATMRETLRRAELPKAREVIVTVNRDDTTILTTLTVRQLNRTAHVVAAVRDSQNLPLVRQSGADAVITSSDSVGRLMGLSSISPYLGDVIEDLLTSGSGLEVSQRQVRPEEEGINPREVVGERVLAVIRNKTMRRFYESSADTLQLGDEIVVVRKSQTGQRVESTGT